MNMEKHWEDQPSRGDGTRAERLRRFKGVGVAFEERAFEVEFERDGIGLDPPTGIACNGQRTRLNGRSGIRRRTRQRHRRQISAVLKSKFRESLFGLPT